MKMFIKIHMNPIHRDLLLIMTAGFFLAMAIVSVVSFVFH